MSVEAVTESPTLLRRLDHIQALRGFAALLVVISHLLIIERKYSPDQLIGDWAVYGMVGVDLFFVISGFVMVYVMWDKPRGIKAASEFLLGRTTRIYPIYWIVSLVLLVLWFVRPDMVFSSIDAPANILKSIALFPHEREPLLAVGWTLVHEMYFYLVFGGLMLLPRKALFPCLMLWMTCVFLFRNVAGLTPAGDAYVFKLVVSGMTYEFIVGALMAGAWLKGKEGTNRTWPRKFDCVFSSLLIAIGSFWLFKEVSYLQDFSSSELRGGRLAVPCGAVVLGLARRDDLGKLVSKPLVILGDWSYALYLTHVLSLTVMGRVWAKFSRESLFDNVSVLIVMVAVTILISGFVYHQIERPIIKAARVMRERLFH